MGPLQGLFKVNQVFKGLEENAKELGVDLLLQKLVYVAAQVVIAAPPPPFPPPVTHASSIMWW